MSVALRRELPAVLVLVLGVLATHPDLLRGPRYGFGDDCLEYAVPYATFVLREFGEGRIPLWNPYTDGGAPLHAQPPFLGPFHPGLGLFALLPPGRALDAGFAIHLLVLALGAHVLLRALGARSALAALGAFVCAASSGPSQQVHQGYLPELVAFAALPWLWACLELARRPGASTGRIAGAGGLLLGLTLLGGHYVTLAAVLLAFLTYAVVAIPAAPGPEARRRIALVAAAVPALGVGVAAIQLLPTLDLALGGSSGADRPVDPEYASLTRWWRQLSFLVPRWGAEQKDHLFAGLIAVAAAPLALRARPRALAPLVAVAIVLGLASLGPVNPLLDGVRALVPPARAVSYFYFFKGPVAFSLAILGALGLERLADREEDGPLLLGALLAAGTGGLLLTLVGLRDLPDGNPLRPGLTTSRPWIAAVVALGAIAVAARSRLPDRRALVAALAGLLVLEMTAYALGASARRGDPFRAGTYYEATAVLRDPGPGRWLRIERTRPPGEWTLKRNEGLIARLESVERSAKLPSDRFAELSRALAPLTNDWVEGLRAAKGADGTPRGRRIELRSGSRAVRVLDLMQVTRLHTDLPVDGDAFREVTEGVFRRTRPAPRFWLTHRAEPVPAPSPGRVLGSPDPFAVPVIEGGVDLDPAAPRGARPVEGGFVDTDRIELRVEAPAAGLLVASVPHERGWRAEVDGTPARVLPANHAFLAVPLPAGARIVVLTYRPRTWWPAVGISIAGGLLALWFVGRRERSA